MTKKAFLFLLLAAVFSPAFSQVSFKYCSFEFAKNTAAAVQKPFFVYFTSQDCSDCAMMDKTTFTDLSLATFLNDNANAYKVDTETKFGISWANKFSVYKAPVILFFDELGNMTKRIEQPITSKEIEKILIDPSSYQPSNGQFAVLKDEMLEAEKPAMVNHEMTRDVSTFDAPEAVNEDAPEIKNEGKFTVQLGVFSKTSYAQRLARDISDTYPYAVNVREDVVNGRYVQRVWVGEFTNLESATAVYEMMKSDGRDAIIKEK